MQKYIVLCGVLCVSVLQADGVLDPNFGHGLGYITMPEGFYARGVVLQPDTKIVVVGSDTSNNFQIVRYNADGSFDLNFNTTDCCMGGTGQTGPAGIPFSVCLQPDGSLIVAGQDASGSHFQLAKYTPGGELDPTFGIAGVVVGPVGYAIDAQITYVATTKTEIDERIIVVGTDDSGHLLVVRYNANGSIASTFNVGAFGFAESLQIQHDGKIVIAGTNNAGNMQIVRYTSTGQMDTSFGTGGVVTSTVQGVATSLLIQPNGMYVIGGYTRAVTPQMTLVRYTNAGVLDASFGTGGIVTGPAHFLATCAALQSDGSIVVGGEGSSGIKLTRYTNSGTLDASFGTGGVVTTGTIGDVFGLAMQTNGYIVTVGMDPIASNFQVARYTGSASMAATAFTSANLQQTGILTVTGTAQNPSQLYLYLESSFIDTIVTDAGGANTWAVPVTINYPGLYTMRAFAFYKDANLATATMDELRVYGNKIS